MANIKSTTDINFSWQIGEGPTHYDIPFDAFGDNKTDSVEVARIAFGISYADGSYDSFKCAGISVEKIEVGEFDNLPGDDLKIFFESNSGLEDSTIWDKKVTGNILTLTSADLQKRRAYLLGLKDGTTIEKIVASPQDEMAKARALITAFSNFDGDDIARFTAIEKARSVLEPFLKNGDWKNLTSYERIGLFEIFSISGPHNQDLLGLFPTWSFTSLWKIVTDESNDYQDKTYAAFGLAGAQDENIATIEAFLNQHKSMDEISKGICASLTYSHVTHPENVISQTPYCPTSEKAYFLEIINQRKK